MTDEADKVDDENGHDGLGGGPDGDVPMSFFDHLAELRTRLVRAAIGVVIGFSISFYFVHDLLDLLKRPLQGAWEGANLPGRPNLQVLEIQGALMTDIRLGITGAIFIAGPIIFWQLWKFVSPGLYKNEKRFIIPFVIISVLMFFAGGWFAYTFVLPFALQWLLGYPGTGFLMRFMVENDLTKEGDLVYQLELANYVKGSTRILLAFGCIFELPLLVAFLAKAGVVNHRMLLKFWKVAVLIIFVVAGVLTPPEPVTQMMMAGPLCVLFFISVGVAYFLNPAPPEEEYEEIEDDEDDDGRGLMGLFDDEDDDDHPVP